MRAAAAATSLRYSHLNCFAPTVGSSNSWPFKDPTLHDMGALKDSFRKVAHRKPAGHLSATRHRGKHTLAFEAGCNYSRHDGERHSGGQRPGHHVLADLSEQAWTCGQLKLYHLQISIFILTHCTALHQLVGTVLRVQLI